MKNRFTQWLYKAVLIVLCLSGSFNSFGDHIAGAGLSYSYVSGSTYKITLTIYGSCGSGFLTTLPYATPQILIYNGGTYTDSIHLVAESPDSGTEVIVYCLGDTTQCTSTSSTIPGVKKFVYSGNYTLPSTSAAWRFIYNGYMGTAAAAGRAASITNLNAPGSTLIQLEDTLNNTVYNSTSPVIHSNLEEAVALNSNDFYSPFAVDSSGDALTYMLVPAMNGTGTATIGSAVGYLAGVNGSNPIQNTTSFTMNNTTGQMGFYPTVLQRSVVVYNIEARRAGTMVGTSQVEVSIVVLSGTPSDYAGEPCVGSANYFKGCGSDPDTVRVSSYATGCGLSGLQWQSSPDSIIWTNISGATSGSYIYTSPAPVYYRCSETSSYDSLTSYSIAVHVPASHYSILQSTILNLSDTLCDSARFYVAACDLSASYSVTTWYGDGTSNNIALSTTGICDANIAHWYSTVGTYLIKQVLYNAGVAIDSVMFPYAYFHCRSLQVKFYYDADSNCVYGGGDVLNFFPLTVEVDSNGVALDTFSATSGLYYKANGGPGTVYSFKILSVVPGLMVSCPMTGILYDTIQSSVSTYPIRYFGLRYIPGSGAFDLAVNTVIWITGVHDEWGDIYVRNNLGPLMNATVTLNFSTKYGFYDATPMPATTTGNTVTWNLSGLYPGSAIKDIYYELWQNSVPLTAGDTVHSTITVTPTIGDVNPYNNYCVILDTVKAGCDPNEMSVSPAGCIAVDTVTQLEYTINFVNTGNDTAFNIYVMDTLSPNVNPHSLKIVMASAAMNIEMINDGVNNIVKFDLPNINLLDSSHHSQCSGAVIFDINTKQGLADGATIFNHAGIFFDYNPVVMTDIVENIMGCPSPLIISNNLPISNKVFVFPNPVTDELTITMDQGAYTSFTITNSIGQQMIQQLLSFVQTKVNVKMLPAGLYYITFRGGNGINVQKFVKE